MNNEIIKNDFSITTYISKQDINKRIEELGKKITKDNKGYDELIIICLLKGSFMFFTDLVKYIDIDKLKIEFMKVSSYGNGKESGDINIQLDLQDNIFDKNVLIVDDIIDTGKTAYKIIELLRERNPKNIETCFLLNKEANRQYNVKVNYYGFKVDNLFLGGYGLDYKQYYRNLEYVGIIKEK